MLVAAALLLSACGDDNRLTGTISADATLAFDEVRAEWLVDELSVRYLSGRDLALQEPARLTLPASLAVTGAELAIERAVRVEHFVTTSNSTGRVTPEKPFPPVSHGVLRLTSVGTVPGERVEGDFQVTFTGAEDTLNGNFSAVISPPK